MSNVINLSEADKRGPLEVEEVPAEFPIPDEGCFYGVAGRFARDACMQSEADPIGVLIHLLTWVGTYFGSKAVLRLGDVEAPPRLFSVTTSTSGGGKGTAAAPVRKLMLEYVNVQLRKLGLPPALYRDGPMSSGEGLAWAVRDPADTEDEDGNPIDKGVTDKRLMILEEEFAAVLQAARREGNTVSAAIRRFWDSGSFSPLTKNNRVTVTDAHVCFVGHITYEELVKRLEQSEYSSALASRIIWICVRRSKIVPVPESIPVGRMLNYADAVAKAIQFSSDTNELSLSPASLDIWSNMAVSLAKESSPMSERARVQVLRMAGIFALLDCTDRVMPQHLEAASHIWRYSVGSIAYIFENDENEDAHKLLTALRKHGALTTTQIRVSVFQQNIKSATMNTLLKTLEAQGKIKRIVRPRKDGKRGKSATVFELTRK
ncbi:MAG: replication-relaxation family protein [Gammaproteobacteria bacterium]|nr:replication-relaxation family protein [Gammaproteobacteria bacterium]MBU1722499.1 replication-relaxation family protein [Gammaproteobacteria bacterium]MBU2005532.1 replication-relaxation family protein [Gammaproteobacteria bacterium]